MPRELNQSCVTDLCLGRGREEVKAWGAKGFDSPRDEKNGITSGQRTYFSFKNKIFVVLFVEPSGSFPCRL